MEEIILANSFKKTEVFVFPNPNSLDQVCRISIRLEDVDQLVDSVEYIVVLDISEYNLIDKLRLVEQHYAREFYFIPFRGGESASCPSTEFRSTEKMNWTSESACERVSRFLMTNQSSRVECLLILDSAYDFGLHDLEGLRIEARRFEFYLDCLCFRDSDISEVKQILDISDFFIFDIFDLYDVEEKIRSLKSKAKGRLQLRGRFLKNDVEYEEKLIFQKTGDRFVSYTKFETNTRLDKLEYRSELDFVTFKEFEKLPFYEFSQSRREDFLLCKIHSIFNKLRTQTRDIKTSSWDYTKVLDSTHCEVEELLLVLTRGQNLFLLNTEEKLILAEFRKKLISPIQYLRKSRILALLSDDMRQLLEILSNFFGNSWRELVTKISKLEVQEITTKPSEFFCVLSNLPYFSLQDDCLCCGVEVLWTHDTLRLPLLVPVLSVSLLFSYRNFRILSNGLDWNTIANPSCVTVPEPRLRQLDEENLKACFPLFLDSQHWEKAKHFVSPCLGFICARDWNRDLDSDLSLSLRILASSLQTKSELTEVISQTCRQLLTENHGFRIHQENQYESLMSRYRLRLKFESLDSILGYAHASDRMSRDFFRAFFEKKVQDEIASRWIEIRYNSFLQNKFESFLHEARKIYKLTLQAFSQDFKIEPTELEAVVLQTMRLRLAPYLHAARLDSEDFVYFCPFEETDLCLKSSQIEICHDETIPNEYNDSTSEEYL